MLPIRKMETLGFIMFLFHSFIVPYPAEIYYKSFISLFVLTSG